MNVSGLPRRTVSPNTSSRSAAGRILAISASAGADSNSTCARRANSSSTSKPTLWRVPRYRAPGLPSPKIAFNSLLLLFLCFLRFLFLLLALLDDFRFGRCRGRRGRRLGRRRRLLGPRHDDVHEHRVAFGQRLPFGIDRHVADTDTLVQHQLADVDLDMLWNV